MIRNIKKYKWVSAMIGAALALVLIGFIRAVASSTGHRTALILHFNDLQGITASGGVGTFIFMGIFGVAAILVNAALSFELEARHSFFGKITAAGALTFAILLFIAYAAIISVN